MNRFRQLNGVGGWARNFALFALLIQFTLPIGLAISADLPGAQFDPAAVFDCLGGDPNDPKSSDRVWHGCALPGGCCVPGGAPCALAASAKGDGADMAAAPPARQSPHVPARPSVQNLVRGPPSSSA